LNFSAHAKSAGVLSELLGPLRRDDLFHLLLLAGRLFYFPKASPCFFIKPQSSSEELMTFALIAQSYDILRRQNIRMNEMSKTWTGAWLHFFGANQLVCP